MLHMNIENKRARRGGAMSHIQELHLQQGRRARSSIKLRLCGITVKINIIKGVCSEILILKKGYFLITSVKFQTKIVCLLEDISEKQ